MNYSIVFCCRCDPSLDPKHNVTQLERAGANVVSANLLKKFNTHVDPRMATGLTQNKENTSSDSDMFSSQPQSNDSDCDMFSSQSQPPQTDREIELDLQFEVKKMSFNLL